MRENNTSKELDEASDTDSAAEESSQKSGLRDRITAGLGSIGFGLLLIAVTAGIPVVQAYLGKEEPFIFEHGLGMAFALIVLGLGILIFDDRVVDFLPDMDGNLSDVKARHWLALIIPTVCGGALIWWLHALVESIETGPK